MELRLHRTAAVTCSVFHNVENQNRRWFFQKLTVQNVSRDSVTKAKNDRLLRTIRDRDSFTENNGRTTTTIMSKARQRKPFSKNSPAGAERHTVVVGLRSAWRAFYHWGKRQRSARRVSGGVSDENTSGPPHLRKRRRVHVRRLQRRRRRRRHVTTKRRARHRRRSRPSTAAVHERFERPRRSRPSALSSPRRARRSHIRNRNIRRKKYVLRDTFFFYFYLFPFFLICLIGRFQIRHAWRF